MRITGNLYFSLWKGISIPRTQSSDYDDWIRDEAQTKKDQPDKYGIYELYEEQHPLYDYDERGFVPTEYYSAEVSRGTGDPLSDELLSDEGSGICGQALYRSLDLLDPHFFGHVLFKDIRYWDKDALALVAKALLAARSVSIVNEDHRNLIPLMFQNALSYPVTALQVLRFQSREGLCKMDMDTLFQFIAERKSLKDVELDIHCMIGPSISLMRLIESESLDHIQSFRLCALSFGTFGPTLEFCQMLQALARRPNLVHLSVQGYGVGEEDEDPDDTPTPDHLVDFENRGLPFHNFQDLCCSLEKIQFCGMVLMHPDQNSHFLNADCSLVCSRIQSCCLKTLDLSSCIYDPHELGLVRGDRNLISFPNGNLVPLPIDRDSFIEQFFVSGPHSNNIRFISEEWTSRMNAIVPGIVRRWMPDGTFFVPLKRRDHNFLSAPDDNLVPFIAEEWTSRINTTVQGIVDTCPFLVHLRLTACSIVSLSPFEPLLLGPNAILETLSLQANEIGIHEFKAFAKLLPGMKCIRFLNFAFNPLSREREEKGSTVMSDAEWDQLETDISNHPTLEGFDICYRVNHPEHARARMIGNQILNDNPTCPLASPSVGDGLWPVLFGKIGRMKGLSGDYFEEKSNSQKTNRHFVGSLNCDESITMDPFNITWSLLRDRAAPAIAAHNESAGLLRTMIADHSYTTLSCLFSSFLGKRKGGRYSLFGLRKRQRYSLHGSSRKRQRLI